MINAQTLQGQWNEIKGTLKQHWGALTNDDLRVFNGNVDQLVGLIQRKTGESRDAVHKYLEDVTADASSIVSSAVETARGVVDRASGAVHDAYDGVSDRMRDRYADAEEMVRSRPVESIAFAFGAGVFAGIIVGLVMRHR